MQHNLLWLAFLALVATPLGLLLAVLLDQKIRGSKIYQSIFFAPVMLSLALIGIIWQLFYQRDNGLLNFLLGTSGTPQAVDWFGDSSVNIWAALIAATWRHAGYVMMLYLAGPQGRRSEPQGGRRDRRRECGADLLPGGLPGHAPHQHRDRRHHHHRIAACVRRCLRHQPRHQRP